MPYKTTFVTIKFYYSNGATPKTVIIPISNAKQAIQRIISRDGVIVLEGTKIDLIIVDKIELSFSEDIAL